MIIDASVAFKWLVAEPDSHLAIAWIGREELGAPALLHAEIGNALWKSIKRQELPDDHRTRELGRSLDQLVIYLDERPVASRALELAVELDHAIYDCIYLALAEARSERLLTADERFIRKARLAGYGHLLQALDAQP